MINQHCIGLYGKFQFNYLIQVVFECIAHFVEAMLLHHQRLAAMEIYL